ncbi:unnamed protein product [Diatraea saccharalis]|uniref:Uncharacterized protein n=1 Tax=Diatraea saccharalis TaxID=40085 RepID=A0A9N9WGI9_9NEOP|nr:unnamed protein product [Diatraea saccharalis]
MSYKIANLDIPPNCCPIIELPSIRNLQDILIVRDLIANYNGTPCTRIEAFEGCTTAALNSVYLYYSIISTSTLVLVVMELIAMVSAFYLSQHYANQKKNIKGRSTTNRIN